MKKFISISLSILLILSTVLCGISVNAAEDTAGSTVTYKFLVTTDTDISAFQGFVKYPADKLAIASEEDIVVYDGKTGSVVANDLTNEQGTVLFNGSAPTAVYSFDDTALVTINFTVLDQEFDPKAITTTVQIIYDPAHVLSGNIPFSYKNVVDDTVTLSGYVDLDNEENSYVDPTEEPTTASSETEPTETSSETEATETSSETEATETSSETEATETSSETEATEPSSETEATEPSSETEPVPTESTEAPTLPAEGTFHVVAGMPELCNGVNWDPASPLNLMTLGEDEVYSITYTNVPAGTYKFKVTTNGAWDNADFNLVGDAKFGGPDAEITVTEDNSTVVISLKESDMHANAYINGVLVDMGATEPTKPTETEPKPTETQPTDPVCAHNETKTDGAKAATYFEKGYTGDVVCADCGEVIEAGKPIAVKKLKTPKVTVKGAKKAIKVTYKKVKDAKGFNVTYKLGKKTFNKKFTLSKKELKKAKVTKTIKVKKAGKYKVTVKAFVTSGKKIAYSKPTKTVKVKVK